MILKVWNPNTSRWRMFETCEVEVGDGWLGSFGVDLERDWKFALYSEPEELGVKEFGQPIARRAPLLIAGANNDLFVDDTACGPVIDSNGKDRVKVKMAVFIRTESEGGDKVIAFNTPAYLMNDAGKTIEKL